MADFKLATTSAKQEWVKKFVKEFVRESGFLPYMGSTDQNIIRVRNELKGAGNLINIPLVRKLSGAGVSGATALEGAEDTLGNSNDQVRIAVKRNGVVITKNETFKTELDLFDAARGQLKSQASENLSDAIIEQLGAVVVKGTVDADGFSVDTTVPYATATAAQRNAHLVANLDRIVFANGTPASATVMATAIAGVTAGDKMSAGLISGAKRKAQKTATASAIAITPYKSDVTEGREWYVMFVGPEGMRDAANDATILAANSEARVRGLETNPIFQGGDLYFDGILIREIAKLGNLGAVGAAGATVAMAHLCGLSAVTVAWGQEPEMVRNVRDYGFKIGIGLEEIRGVKKTSFDGVQYGTVTIFHAATPDSF